MVGSEECTGEEKVKGGIIDKVEGSVINYHRASPRSNDEHQSRR